MSGSRIAHLRLAAFRSWNELRLDLDGRPVAIFGPNGAGKTNILEAISLLSPGRGLRRAAPQEFGRAQAGIGWRIAAEVEALGHAHEVETGAEGDASRHVEIDGKTATQLGLGRILRMLWLVPSMDRLWTEGAGERRRFLDRMALSFEPSHGEAASRYERAMRERNRLLKDGGPSGWFDALEAQMAESGAAMARVRARVIERLADAQEGAATAFPRADLALVTPEGTPEPEWDDLAGRLAANRRRDSAAGRTLEGPHRADLEAIYTEKRMEARACSTGEQKALLLSLVLANARALAAETGAPPLLLLDEVSAHLDEDRRAALYDEICTLGTQAWMTGTGPELFTALGDRAMHIEVREGEKGSVAHVLD